MGVGVASFFSLVFFFRDVAFDFGVGDASDSGVGFFFIAGVLLGSGDSAFFSVVFGFGVASSSSSPVDFFVADFSLDFGEGDSSGSGAGLFLASGVGVGVAFGLGLECFFALDLRSAGFGLAVGSGISDGVGEAIARISSRALLRASRFFFSSSVNCA